MSYVSLLNEKNIQDFYKVFEGDFCENCQCTYYHKMDKDLDWEEVKLETTRQWRNEVTSKMSDGYIYYQDDRPVGWCQCTDADNLPLVKDMIQVKENDSHILTCLFLRKEFRHKGLVKDLLKKVLEALFEKRIKVVYSMPTLDEVIEKALDKWKDMEMHTGNKALFDKFGFKEVGKGKRYYFMKKTLLQEL